MNVRMAGDGGVNGGVSLRDEKLPVRQSEGRFECVKSCLNCSLYRRVTGGVNGVGKCPCEWRGKLRQCEWRGKWRR